MKLRLQGNFIFSFIFSEDFVYFQNASRSRNCYWKQSYRVRIPLYTPSKCNVDKSTLTTSENIFVRRLCMVSDCAA